MAIGVSYRGHNGRSAQFTTEGNPAPGSELDKIVRGGNAGAEVSAVMNPLMQAMNRGRHPQAPDPRSDKAAGTVKLSDADYRPGTLSEKVKPDGSIKVDRDGLCLKGDDSSVSDGFYAKRNGVTAFLSLDDMDNPNERGEIVGALNVEDRFSTSDKTTGGQIGAYGVNMQSRTEAEIDEDAGKVTFWEYTKRIDVTKGRRVGEFGSESKRKICSFFLGGDRQITLTRPRSPFTIVRSHYFDKEGKEQYEFWAKCLKWGDGNKIQYGADLYGGVYKFGDYGHYPQRPSGRPSRLVFDSGREALVEEFEENSKQQVFYDNCNCWTYIGGSEEGMILGKQAVGGNVDLYGAYCIYYIPKKSGQAQGSEFEVTYTNIANVISHTGIKSRTDPHGTYTWEEDRQMCITAENHAEHELFNFMDAKGSLVAADAHSNDGYDRECVRSVTESRGSTLIDAVRSPDCNDAFGDTDKFPSKRHLELSASITSDYDSYDFTLYDWWGWQGSDGHWVIWPYPREKERYIANEWPIRIRETITAMADLRFKPGMDVPVVDHEVSWNKFFNYSTMTREKYNGNWKDYFPFFIKGLGDDFSKYFWWEKNQPSESRKMQKICEIKDWEIVSNDVGNKFYYVVEDGAGNIKSIAMKNFGDKVKTRKGELPIRDDYVLVERDDG